MSVPYLQFLRRRRSESHVEARGKGGCDEATLRLEGARVLQLAPLCHCPCHPLQPPREATDGTRLSAASDPCLCLCLRLSPCPNRPLLRGLSPRGRPPRLRSTPRPRTPSLQSHLVTAMREKELRRGKDLKMSLKGFKCIEYLK